MGVAGSGKTTVGRLLADRLRLPFHDADDYHSPADVAKMQQGNPLTDDDRKPWLEAIARGIAQWNRHAGAVLACSALRESYRRTLTRDGAEQVVFIHLAGAPDLIRSRVRRRQDHYFPEALVDSQLEILEVPAGVVSIDLTGPPDEVCLKIIRELSARGLIRPPESVHAKV